MTGRIVDSCTGIATVKLFSHSKRETEYAEEGMEGFLDTMYRQMRLYYWLQHLCRFANYLLVFSIAGISIYLWLDNAITTVGAIAIAVSLALRINGVTKMDHVEIGGLFENLGTVIDGE